MLVYNAGALFHESSVSNNYGPTSTINLAGGGFNLGVTTQTLSSLTMDKQAIVQGSAGSKLLLTHPTTALSLTGGGTVIVDHVGITNGGAITNSGSPTGEAFIVGIAAPQGFTDIDLGGTTVPINAQNNALSGPQKFDLLFYNIHFSNGSLQKIGSGQINIVGNSNKIPSLAIINGQVQLGSAQASALADGPSTITMSPGTLLNGFGTLGINGNVTLQNTSGILFPGDLYHMGSLSILGDYEQGASAALLIQGQSEAVVNTLTIKDGDVVLGGRLYFSTLQGADMAPNDQLVLIAAPDGTISGRFTEFHADLPQGLAATLIYGQKQVIMRITTCN